MSAFDPSVPTTHSGTPDADHAGPVTNSPTLQTATATENSSAFADTSVPEPVLSDSQQQEHQQQEQEQDHSPPTDPAIIELRSIFPDYDDLILQSVLESVNGNQARAIDLLLGMSDPEYKGEPSSVPSATPNHMTQTELDEQFARQLLLEEQEKERLARQRRAHARSQTHQLHLQGTDQQQQQQQQSGDTMAEIQQQFNKFAESGKKSVGTFFSKVKAKIQEFDQQRQGQGSNQPATSNSIGGYDPSRHEDRVYRSSSSAHFPHPSQPEVHQPQVQQTHNQIRELPAPTDPFSSTDDGAKGYNTTPELVKESNTTPNTSILRSRNSFVPSSPPKSIDAGKLGLLPKRPVSLLNSQPPASIQRLESQESDDGLEYTENPFEEHKK